MYSIPAADEGPQMGVPDPTLWVLGVAKEVRAVSVANNRDPIDDRIDVMDSTVVPDFERMSWGSKEDEERDEYDFQRVSSAGDPRIMSAAMSIFSDVSKPELGIFCSRSGHWLWASHTASRSP